MCKLHNATVYLTLGWRLSIFLSFLIELFLMNKNIIEVQQNDDMIFTYQIKLSRTVKEGDKNQKKTHIKIISSINIIFINRPTQFKMKNQLKNV